MQPGRPGPGTSLRRAFAWGKACLERSGVAEAGLEARVLLGEAAGLDPGEVLAGDPGCLGVEAAERYCRLVRQRGDQRRPLQYVLGRVEFFSLPFAVREGAFIPRPETELLVEEVLRRLDPARPWLVVDVGTGSGVVAVCLALRLPRARVYALDCSPQALEVAGENARRHKVEDRVVLLEGDLLEPLWGAQPCPGLRADVLVSNPPYVAAAELEALEPEVAVHEPREALDGGPDGLGFYRRLVPQAGAALAGGGLLALEVAAGRAAQVAALVAAAGFEGLEVVPDYAGIPRVVLARGAGRGGPGAGGGAGEAGGVGW